MLGIETQSGPSDHAARRAWEDGGAFMFIAIGAAIAVLVFAIIAGPPR